MYQVRDKLNETVFTGERLTNCLSYLLQDETVQDIAEADYMTHKEGLFNEDEFAEFFWANIEEYGAEAGFTIKEIK